MFWLGGALTVLIVLAAGCGETVLTQWPRETIFSNYFHLQEIKPGMNRMEVEGIMGQPAAHETGDYPGGQYTIYFYRTHNMDYDGSETVRGGYTPILFQKNTVVAMGRRSYLRAVGRPVHEPLPALPPVFHGPA
jgi:outer membrane protein assembly factor BamE (lipoprotein component of BamABCDE complex)